MVRRALTRQTRWCQNCCFIFKIKDFIDQKPFLKILEFWPPGDLNFDLSQKMTEMISKWFFASFRTPFSVLLYTMRRSRDRRGGGGWVQTPPPPAGGGKSRGPSGHGLSCLPTTVHTNADRSTHLFYSSLRPSTFCILFVSQIPTNIGLATLLWTASRLKS